MPPVLPGSYVYADSCPVIRVVDCQRKLRSCPPGEVLTYFSVRGRAAEQGIIFRIPTPGQGIIFVKRSSMTGSIFVIIDSERSFRPFALCECDSNRLDGNISTFFDRFRTNFLARHNFVQRNKRTRYCVRKFYSGTG